MYAPQMLMDTLTDFNGRIGRILFHHLEIIRQQCEPLIDIVVKFSCDPSTFVFLRFKQPAANF